MDPAASPVPSLVAAFAALAHPQRLEVVRLLMRHHPARMAAGDIGTALGLLPSTLSGYLAQLMAAGLITQDRRGTSLLYTASPAGASALTAAWIGPICGGRGWPAGFAPGRQVRNLLFVGHANAGPSLMAEAILRHSAGAAFEVFSAGVGSVMPPDTDVMAAIAGRGYDAAALWAKPLRIWQGDGAPRMDVVITLGQRAANLCPDWPGGSHTAAWRLAPGLSVAALHDDLAARIAVFAGLGALTPPQQVQAALDSVARESGAFS